MAPRGRTRDGGLSDRWCGRAGRSTGRRRRPGGRLRSVAVALTLCCFFSSRRRHTRLTCDWSSDVCSSDLGGKCLRGPQCSGVILGRKDLLQAAWVSSAPHHGHGRAMKIGKEEMVGLLAAVEMWMQRDHKKEDETWTQWMQTIADRVQKVDGVTATVRQPRGLGNHSPGLSINWDPAKLGITGEQVSDILWTTEPRIALGGGGGGGPRGARNSNQTGISITAYMMQAGDVKIVADRVHEILSAKRPAWTPES